MSELCDTVLFRHAERKFHISRVHSDHGKIEVAFVREGDVAADRVPSRIRCAEPGGRDRDLESTADRLFIDKCEMIEQRRLRYLDNEGCFAFGQRIVQRFIFERKRSGALPGGFLLIQKKQDQRSQGDGEAAAPTFERDRAHIIQ